MVSLGLAIVYTPIFDLNDLWRNRTKEGTLKSEECLPFGMKRSLFSVKEALPFFGPLAVEERADDGSLLVGCTQELGVDLRVDQSGLCVLVSGDGLRRHQVVLREAVQAEATEAMQ